MMHCMRRGRPLRRAFCPAAVSLCCEPSRHWTACRPRMPTRNTASRSIRRAIEAPVRQIAENAGAEGSIIVGKLRETTEFGYGWNAQTNKFGDLYDQGVIDPVKVVRIALQDAASVAGLLLTTEAMVAEKPKKDVPVPPMPTGGMDF